MSVRVHGSCHCGYITFTSEGDPERTVVCHCRDCQVMSGGPYRSIVPSDEAAFELLSGELSIYHKVGDSGNARELAFCNKCGSHIYATSKSGEGIARSFGLRTGVLAEVAEFAPMFQVWCDSRLPWVTEFNALPGKPKQ